MESKRKSTKKTPNLKDLSVQQRRLALLKQKQCDSIALNIVTKLIECQIEEDVFLKSLKYLNQCHYDDIVEERELSRLCGYPICGNTLPDMPKKTFHISTKLNKVYDITERKNYCSNYCYKAGLYIKEQMLISPLWYRDQEEIPDFHLLPANVSGSPGREIDHGLIKADSIDTNQFTSATALAHDILTDNKINIDCKNSNSTAPKTNLNETKLDSNNSIINTDTKIGNQLFCLGMPSLADILKENAEYFENDTNGTKDHTVINLDTNGTKDHTVINTETIHTNLDKIEAEKLPADSDKPVKGILSKRKQPFGKNTQEKRVSFSSDTKQGVEIDTKNHSLNSNKNHVNVNVIGSVHEKSEIYKNELTQLETNNQVLNENESKTNRLNRLKNSSTYKRANSLSKSVQKPIPLLQQNLKQRVLKCLNEWITLDTIIFLYGVDFVKNRSEKLYEKYMKRKSTLDLDDQKQSKYDSICKQLSLMELRDRKFDESVTGKKLRPLPSFDKLRDEAETMDLKVRAFYLGCYEDDGESETESVDDSYEVKGAPAVLPLVESKDIGNIRKKIFLTSLSRTVPNICEIFKQCPNYLLSDIKNLIDTFEFTAENIVFKTAEWSFITFMLIQLLSIRDKDLRIALDLEESKRYISSLQKQFMVETSHLDSYLSKTVDINRFMKE